MKLEVDEILYYIAEASQFILEHTSDLTLDEYERNQMLYLAVERQFITIGEAINLLLSADAALAHRLTNYRRIINFRNKLVHDFADRKHELVWAAITDHLSILLLESTQLLQEIEAA